MEAPNPGSTSTFYLASGDESGHNDVSVSSLSDAIIQHTLKLYKYMVSDPNKKDTNIMTSPYSIWTALALTYLGSRKESSEILGSLLGVDGMNKAKVEEKMKEMSAKIGSGDGNIFTVANKIAIDQKMKIKDCVTKDPSLPIEKVDFFGNPEQVRLNLNKWVENKTSNLIKDLLPKDTIDSMTVMAILNAVYFKGSWEKKFNQKHT
ncbi:Serpin B6 [Nymphon striatum]|nr:Serpin B6 [Nymphon striatum]